MGQFPSLKQYKRTQILTTYYSSSESLQKLLSLNSDTMAPKALILYAILSFIKTILGSDPVEDRINEIDPGESLMPQSPRSAEEHKSQPEFPPIFNINHLHQNKSLILPKRVSELLSANNTSSTTTTVTTEHQTFKDNLNTSKLNPKQAGGHHKLNESNIPIQKEEFAESKQISNLEAPTTEGVTQIHPITVFPDKDIDIYNHRQEKDIKETLGVFDKKILSSESVRKERGIYGGYGNRNIHSNYDDHGSYGGHKGYGGHGTYGSKGNGGYNHGTQHGNKHGYSKGYSKGYEHKYSHAYGHDQGQKFNAGHGYGQGHYGHGGYGQKHYGLHGHDHGGYGYRGYQGGGLGHGGFGTIGLGGIHRGLGSLLGYGPIGYLGGSLGLNYGNGRFRGYRPFGYHPWQGYY